MSSAFRISFTLVFTAVIFCLSGFLLEGIYKQFASCHYSNVTGHITDSEVRTSHSSRHGSSHRAYISYTYEVDRQIFSGSRLRYTGFTPADYLSASQLVNTYPTGSARTIFYDPAHPEESLLCSGIIGHDLIGLLLLSAVTIATVGLWISLGSWLRERWFKPLAGGVKLIIEPSVTRIRLPPPKVVFRSLLISGSLSIFSLFILNTAWGMNVPVAYVLIALGISYLAGVAVYGFSRFREESGIYDLTIDEFGRKVSLPAMFERNTRVVLNISEVQQIRVIRVEHRGSKGGIYYTYAPSLALAPSESAIKKSPTGPTA